MAAIQAGDRSKVGQLLEDAPELAAARTDSGVSGVCLAMYHGYPNIAQDLAARGATLDIFDAAALGDASRVHKLVESDPAVVQNFSPDGFPPLGLAAYFGHAEIVEYLLDHGADIEAAANNAMQVRPIHAAVARRSARIVRTLLERGADPNSQQQAGFTPMDAAVRNGDQEIIDLLLKHGATPRSSAQPKT